MGATQHVIKHNDRRDSTYVVCECARVCVGTSRENLQRWNLIRTLIVTLYMFVFRINAIKRNERGREVTRASDKERKKRQSDK